MCTYTAVNSHGTCSKPIDSCCVQAKWRARFTQWREGQVEGTPGACCYKFGGLRRKCTEPAEPTGERRCVQECAHTHARTHTYPRMCTYARIHKRTCTPFHTHTHAHTRNTHTCIRTFIHSYICTYIHTFVRTYAYIHTYRVQEDVTIMRMSDAPIA